MCRFLACLGPDVSLESLLLAPPWSLLRQSYEPRFMKRGRVNADGFGAGWYDFDVRQEPALYRRATPVWAHRAFPPIPPPAPPPAPPPPPPHPPPPPPPHAPPPPPPPPPP